MDKTIPPAPDAGESDPATAIAASQGAARNGGSAAIGRGRAFRFGDPEPILERRDFLGYAEVMQNGRWYEPPIPMHGLARAYDMSPHHRSALLYKRNQLLRFFKPTTARKT